MAGRTIALVAMLALPAPVFAQEILNQILREGNNSDHDVNYHAPNGRWMVHIPYGMALQSSDDPDMVLFSGKAGAATAQILIQRVSVEPGAASAQLMLTTRDDSLKKLPNFTVLSTHQQKIAGRKCAVLLGRYDYQGNKGYPQAVEQAYVIDGSDGFVIGLEVPLAAYNDMSSRLKQIYESFTPLQPAPAAKEKK